MTAFILMGVSGSGKSTVGKRVADVLGIEFLEGDDFHPPENVARMSAGQALTDADRAPWIDALAEAVRARGGADVIIACSALSRFVRERLRRRIGHALQFIYLSADPKVIQRRLAQRPRHFMKPGMLPSQCAALEPPEHAIQVNVERALDEVCAQVAAHIRAARDPRSE